MAVVEVCGGGHGESWASVGGEVLEPAVDLFALVDAGIEERGDARGRACPPALAELVLVSEPSVGVLAASDVPYGFVDDGGVNMEPGVAGRAQGHHLADGDADVGVVGDGVVAPASLVVLRAFDESDGLDERFVDAAGALVVGSAAGHAVDLAEEERREPVAVHRTVGGLVGDEPGVGDVVEYVVEPSFDGVAVGPAVGEIAVGHESDARERGDGDVAPEPPAAERPVLVLERGEGLESVVDGLVELWCDLVGHGVVFGGRVAVGPSRGVGLLRERGGGECGGEEECEGVGHLPASSASLR